MLTVLLIMSMLFFGVPTSAEAKIEKVYLCPMSHLDIGFTGTQEEVAESQKAILDEVLLFSENLPDFKWTVEQFWQLEQWLKRTHDPVLVAGLTGLARKGRLEITATYGSMHTGFMSGEYLTRMLAPALTFAGQEGLEVVTAIQNDVPGFTRDLPAILAESGIKYLVTGINTSLGFGGFELPIEHNPFYWEGPSRARVLVWVSEDSYLEGYSLTPAKLRQKIAELEEKGYPHDAVMLISAADNADASQAVYSLLNLVRVWNQERLSHEPCLVMATPREFFEYWEEQNRDALPVYSGEWGGLWERNKTTAPVSSSKYRWVRETAPLLEAVAAINQRPITADPLTNLLLLYSEHTAAAGAGWPGHLTKLQTEESNRTVYGWMETAWLLNQEIAERVFPTGLDGEGVTVYNLSSWEQSGPVHLALPAHLAERVLEGQLALRDSQTGQKVPMEIINPPVPGAFNPWRARGLTDTEIVLWVESVPKLGWKRLEWAAEDTADSGDLKPAERKRVVLENDNFRLLYDGERNLCADLYDKNYGHNLVDANSDYPFFSVLQAHHYRAQAGQKGSLVNSEPASVQVWQGEVSSRLILTFGPHDVVRAMEVVLPKYGDYLEWNIVLDQENMEYVPYEEHSHLYFAALPLALPGESQLLDMDLMLEGPETFVTPELYLPGANRNSLIIRRAVGLGADEFGMLVSSRQAFAATLGGIDYVSTQHPASATLIFELVRHFNEAGTRDLGPAGILQEPGNQLLEFQFRLTTTNSGLAREELAKFGQAFALPLFGVHGAAEEITGQFLNFSNPLELISLVWEPSLNGYLLRLKNPDILPQTSQIALPWESRKVSLVDRTGKHIKDLTSFQGTFTIQFPPEAVLNFLIEID